MNQANEPARSSEDRGPESGISAKSREELERSKERAEKLFKRVEHEVERDADKALEALRRRPSIGMLIFGGAAVLAADALGVGEVALGVAIGYAAYQALRGKSEKAATKSSDERSPPV